MITVEIPLRTLETEIALLQSAPEGPQADFIDGALCALMWLKDGGPPPHEEL